MSLDEESLLRTVALENIKSILAARRRAEEALEVRTQELEKLISRMRATLESATDGILVTDRESKVTDFNENYIAMWRIPQDVIAAREHSQLLVTMSQQFNQPQYFLDRVDEIYSFSPPDSYDLLEMTDGRVYERFSKIQMVKGREVGRVWNFRDITERRAIENRLYNALEEVSDARNKAEAANMAKTEFLANMSHEIRTPMNAIIGLSNILGMAKDLPPKLADYVQTLKTSADCLMSLINDLLDLSKIEAQTVEFEHIPFSLTQIVHEVISMMRERLQEKGLTFHLEDECIKNRIFLGDPVRIRQIILNLISNAIKFTEHGSVSAILTCEGMDQNPTVCIAIKDSGIGIPPEKRETIFEKFVQGDTSINRKYGGTGLGLAITKNLTEMMGGTIQVESEPGQGSTFTVCIPCEPSGNTITSLADVQSVVTKMSDQQFTPGKPRILLVDDYAPNILVAATFLEQLGYEHDVAFNGLEAFEKVKLHSYRAILMDVQMHGLNGFDTTQLIRNYEKKLGVQPIPVIGMTALAAAGDRERCRAAGMDDYLAKPLEADELKAKLKKALASAE